MNSAEAMLATPRPLPKGVILTILFAILALAVIGVLLWAVAVRKKKPKRKRRSRHHREHRKVNPTLAESGGLPPAREEKSNDAPTP